MTRKDYNRIAAAFAVAYETCRRNGVEATMGWAEAVHKVAQALAEDNARFDHQRFYAACRGE